MSAVLLNIEALPLPRMRKSGLAKETFILMLCFGSTVVEHSTRNPEVGGSIDVTGIEREIMVMFCNIQVGSLSVSGMLHFGVIWGQCYNKNLSVIYGFLYYARVFVTRLEKLTEGKRSSLFRKSVIYGQKKFYHI